MKKRIPFVLLALTLLSGCGKKEDTHVLLEDITLDQYAFSLKVGEQVDLKAHSIEVPGLDYPQAEFTFTTNDAKVADVTSSGIVKGISTGECYVYVNYLTLSTPVSITVSEASLSYVLDITSADSLSLLLHATYTYQPKAMLGGKEVEAVFTYSDIDTDYLSIDSDGLIKTYKAGKTSFTVKAEYQDHTDEKSIQVEILDQ